MAGIIPKSFIETLMSRIDVVEVISARLQLKKSGTNYTAKCPFHNEKTPSFSVNQNKQFYYCFGCGASGDAITFLINHDRLSFTEAVEELASLASMEVPYEQGSHSGKPEKDHSQLYNVQLSVAQFYQQSLLDHPQSHLAREFLRKRGLKLSALSQFEIGFAPPDWNHLPSGLDSDPLIQLGLLIQKDDGKQFCRFRNRIMFPIRDRRSRIIGFGGRVLDQMDQSTPKYLNSPETAIFQKRHEVYGLHQVLNANDRLKYLLVVEGYMDVVGLSCHGISCAVATLGTASSREQYELLFRYCKRLVLCFDGDQAGSKAAWRAVAILLQIIRPEREISIMQLPDRHDPDSLIRECGREEFEGYIDRAKVMSDFFFEYLSNQHDLNTIEGRTALVSAANPMIATIPDQTYAQLMRIRLAEITKIAVQNPSKPMAPRYSSVRNAQALDSRLSLVAIAVNILAQNPQLIAELYQLPMDWKSLQDDDIDLLLLVYETIENNSVNSFVVLMQELEHHDSHSRLKSLMRPLVLADDALLSECVGTFNRMNKEARQQQINRLVSKAASQQLTAQEKQHLNELLAGK